MAKRFTDSDKWKNPGFRDMANEYRWLWLYVLDNCDAAGIWRLDFALASYCIGYKINALEAAEYFENKVIMIDHDKWFIPSFIAFQYGELHEASRPHQSVIKILVKNGIDPKSLTLSKGYPKGIQTLKEKEQDKEQEQVKEQVKENGECEGVSALDLEKVYLAYPLKKGKSGGLRIAKAQVKSPADLEDLRVAISNYLACLKREGTESKFIKQFKTFMGEWRDWLDPAHGTGESFGEAKGIDWDALERKVTGKQL